jgi:hypothetical protein
MTDSGKSKDESVQSLRKNMRHVERQLGEAIDACTSSMESATFDVIQKQLREAQTLLDELTELNKGLVKAGADSHADPSHSGIQYHQDKLRYFGQSFRRTKQAWEEKRQREELFNHAAHSKEPGDDEDRETSVAMRTMMADSHSLSSSNRNMHSIVSQGEEVKQLLIQGRMALANATSRIQNSIGAFSSIDSVMRLIQRAKVKQTIILGIVIGICVCIFLWMMF